MATLTFVGAAGTVTGSKHLLSVDGKHVLVDCGLYQGPPPVEALNLAHLPVRPREVDAVIVTHGHLDHVGHLPKLVRDGFAGAIYCTPATADVMEIVLRDAAHIQEHLHRRGYQHERAHGLPPFFETADVEKALTLVKPVVLEAPFAVGTLQARFHEAGHILGAAFLELEIGGRRIVFSGDVGRPDRMLLHDPAPLPAADVVVCEATYGDRLHPADPLRMLEAMLLEALRRGGPIVIPAFAVERSQEVLYAIGVLQQRNAAIAAIPVHLDSPMAIAVDALFARHPRAHKPLPDTATFGCRNLTLHVSSDDSKRLNHLDSAAIIVASSGMASGGRVLYHLHRLLRDATATIAFVGFQGAGTLGRALVDGASHVRIFGDSLRVQARIATVGGFSAHADQRELLSWLGTLPTKPRIYFVHAEPPSAAALAALAHERLGLETVVPRRGDEAALG